MVRRLLDKDPELRFQTATELFDALYAPINKKDAEEHDPGFDFDLGDDLANEYISAGPTAIPGLPAVNEGASAEFSPPPVKEESYETAIRDEESADYQFATASYEAVISNKRAVYLLALLLFVVAGVIAWFAVQNALPVDSVAQPTRAATALGLTVEPLPERVRVDAAAGSVRLRAQADETAESTALVYNGAQLDVLSEECGGDSGRWARVRVVSDLDTRAESGVIGAEGWVSVRSVDPPRFGCCHNRLFDCTPGRPDELEFYGEMAVTTVDVRARYDLPLRADPVAHVDHDNVLSTLPSGTAVQIEAESCALTGLRWAQITIVPAGDDAGDGQGEQGPSEDAVSEGWVLRSGLTPNPSGCCLGRGEVDADCSD